MRFIKSIAFVILFGITAAGLTLTPARATPILTIDGSGQLTSAWGVDVGGTLYDVSFEDGTCIASFDGCDAVSDFNFTDSSSAQAAAQALLDQVFVDSGLGQFDSDSSLTFGCTTLACQVSIPFGFSGSGLVTTAVANNASTGGGTDLVFIGALAPSLDLSTNNATNFAVFSITVPEPSTLLLFGVGLAGLAGIARRRQA